MQNVMSSTLSIRLMGWAHQASLCSANLHHLLEHLQTFNTALEEPDILQIKVPRDSPQVQVLQQTFIITNCF